MLSDKEIVCPNNLLDVAHQKKGIPAGIVNAGKSITMMSVMDAVNENLIIPIFIGNKLDIEKCALELSFDISECNILFSNLISFDISLLTASSYPIFVI